MTDLRAVIVDDEQLARDELGYLLGQLGGVEVIGQAGNGVEALTTVERLSPDVLFLDVQMPGLTGFEVAKRLAGSSRPPHVIFVTAYDQHAIEAFEVNAVDYLLKPVDKARLRETLNRAEERMEHDEIVAEQVGRIGAAIDAYEASSEPAYLERIPVRHREEVVLVQAQQVASVVASGELLNITTVRNERHVITYRLKDLERRLDPERFIRLGRGTLVNVDLITKISLMPGGAYVALLTNGQKFPISRLQSRIVRDRLFKL